MTKVMSSFPPGHNKPGYSSEPPSEPCHIQTPESAHLGLASHKHLGIILGHSPASRQLRTRRSCHSIETYTYPPPGRDTKFILDILTSTLNTLNSQFSSIHCRSMRYIDEFCQDIALTERDYKPCHYFLLPFLKIHGNLGWKMNC